MPAVVLLTTRVLAVTGTDTGVGKTVVACALASLAHQRGYRVAVMKPVESGVLFSLENKDGSARLDDDSEGTSHGNSHGSSDAERLIAAARSADSLELVSPYRFEEPLAPMVAAARAGAEIDIDHLDHCRRKLSEQADLLIVEGAGGLMVPIKRAFSYRDLFRLWDAQVVVVAGNKLGVINHTLLTMEALESDGLEVGGIVLSSLSRADSAAADISQKMNFDTLCQLLPEAPLFHLSWLEHVDNPGALAAAAAQAGLARLLPFQAPR